MYRGCSLCCCMLQPYEMPVTCPVPTCRGYNIGIRLVDEFLAKAKVGRCANFREAAEVVAKQAFYMFMNVQAHVANWNAEGTECSLVSFSST